MNKKARDNRANQMNPNNPAYYKSRQGNKSVSRTQVIHHHHNHGRGNQGFACKLCGKRGKLTHAYLDYMRCGYCWGTFRV